MLYTTELLRHINFWVNVYAEKDLNELPLRSTGGGGCGSFSGENGCRIVSIGSVRNFDTISNCADDGGVYQCVATVCWQVCRQMQVPRGACGKAPSIEPPDIWLVHELAHIHWY